MHKNLKVGQTELEPVDPEVLQFFKANWPLAFGYNSKIPAYELTAQTENEDLFVFKLSSPWSDESTALKWYYIRQALIPCALLRFACVSDETLIAGPYIRYDEDDDQYEHGISMLMVPSQGKTKNRETMLFRPERAAEVIQNTIKGKYPALEMFIDEYCDAAAHLLEEDEVIEMHMPSILGKSGHYSFEFMACCKHLVNLQIKPEPKNPCWKIFAEFKINDIDHMPSIFSTTANGLLNQYNCNRVISSNPYNLVETAKKKKKRKPENEIPLETTIARELSIFENSDGLDPIVLTDDDIAQSRQNHSGRFKFVNNSCKPDEDEKKKEAIPYDVMRQRLAVGLQQALRETAPDNTLNEKMIRGIKKPIKRCLKHLLNSPVREKSAKALSTIIVARSQAELHLAIQQLFIWFEISPRPIIKKKDWSPPNDGPVPFKNARMLRRPKLLLLYKIVKRLQISRHYTRDEIDCIISAFINELDESRKRDTNYQLDTLRRNLIDIGYLDRDPHKNLYWLCSPE